MARRSPARYLAPLALVAVCAALFAVVTSTLGNGEGSQATEERPTASPDGADGQPARERRRRARRFYVVRAGDTPGAIAERTGVPLTELERLNPDLDPQQLNPGQRLRLRR
jgi:LysM domain